MSEQTIKDAKYKIICRYVHEIAFPSNVCKSKKGIFFKIVSDEKRKLNLGNNFKFPYHTAISRIRRLSLKGDGTQSPLIMIENKIIDIMLCMSKIKRALTVSEALRLINELIDNTPIQQELISWKLKMKIYYKNKKDLGTVGYKWWNNFLKRNHDRLRSKAGKKYGYNRSNFTTYLNFCDMYNHIEDILVFDSKVATKYDNPVWVNEKGDEVQNEDESNGCKATIHLHRPDMCIVLDEVGCNLSQENDHCKGGQLFVCGANEVPYQSIATKHCHFTCLGLTRLDGHAIMCVVIIQGKRRDPLTESGINWKKLCEGVSIDLNDNMDDTGYFITNYGPGKLFPGGPICNYKGKDVPAFITFSEGGGIDGSILTEIFRRLDNLKIYDDDRAKGLIPFVLLDSHQSRFDLEFLEYINNAEHMWNVTLSVPYGTAPWQVGDSSQQNGMFKMLLTQAKKELFGKRLDSFLQKLNLFRTDIIPLVTNCWPPAFANILNNLKAIRERGWYPYTRVLLLKDVLRATMTEEMMASEIESGLFGEKLLKKLHNVYYEELNGIVTMNCGRAPLSYESKLNFQSGVTAQYVSTTILTESDRQQARQRSQKMKEEGTTVQDRLAKLNKKITAGRMTIDVRKFGLTPDIRDHVRAHD